MPHFLGKDAELDPHKQFRGISFGGSKRGPPNGSFSATKSFFPALILKKRAGVEDPTDPKSHKHCWANLGASQAAEPRRTLLRDSRKGLSETHRMLEASSFGEPRGGLCARMVTLRQRTPRGGGRGGGNLARRPARKQFPQFLTTLTSVRSAPSTGRSLTNPLRDFRMSLTGPLKNSFGGSPKMLSKRPSSRGLFKNFVLRYIVPPLCLCPAPERNKKIVLLLVRNDVLHKRAGRICIQPCLYP